MFGLSDDQFDNLSNLIDTIYHNGAIVNSVLPYSQIRGANVVGTVEIIRLACKNKMKPIHCIHFEQHHRLLCHTFQH
jgi:thioester reductase-like protein